MKTEQFSRIETLVQNIEVQIDTLRLGLNVLVKLPEVAGTAIPGHIERDCAECLKLLTDTNDTITAIRRCLHLYE